MMPTTPSHESLVEDIAEQLRALSQSGEAAHVDKGGVHHFVPLPKDQRFRGRAVDVSRLSRILEIDRERGRATAEPGVTFGELARATLAVGLLPKVVPELEGITVGGAVAGCSVESMSFRYGGFHDSAVEYEVVSGSGEIVRCSRVQEPLLFEMLHGSYGTLGVLSRATFDLVPAKPFVRLEYRRFDRMEAFAEALLEASGVDAGHDFVDAIVHGPREHVLCLGHFADHAPYASNYRTLDIYYKSTRARSEDYLTTADYCFRYDTECHWLSRSFPPLEWRPVRRILGDVFLGSTNMIRWSKRLEPIFGLKRRPDVVVDVFIPAPRLEEFLAWYGETLRYHPLWLVPYRVPNTYAWIAPEHAARMGTSLLIDCAVYGKANSESDVDYARLLEDKTYELGGIKTLISSNYYSRDRFWEIYHRENYLAAKARLDPNGLFADLYDKFNQERGRG